MDIFSEVPDAEYTKDLLYDEFLLHDLLRLINYFIQLMT
ncbi:protein SHORTAGE IN CHIASMATA 1-like isoform X3 [Salvia divinorum]|uniref:Protein SHORTAGE IN CHIASMATA 1-like isoform X3 n=1 Tax=Salvia divinorum TaxID=28513 RepID=A0ABD1HF67_SALDI